VSEERALEPRRRPAAPSTVVSARHLSKAFRLPHERYHTLKERALHPFRARQSRLLPALQDVSLEISPGEFFGIVGRNGSGKSTLLKCLAGIYRIDQGELRVEGRLSPFIELGVGFNPDLTARDNVIINAIMLGLSRRQARARFDSILAFAELQEFVDLKLKNYSSGMYVRLAFATAVQVDAEILLIDEVLAVGDAAFQQKCFEEFGRLKSEGRTILFVTHDMGMVERFCDRAMLLDRGRVVDVGEPASIARQYNQLNFMYGPERGVGAGEEPWRETDADAQVVKAWFESPPGEVTLTARQGERCDVRLDVSFRARVDEPAFVVTLQNEEGHPVFSTSTVSQRVPTGRFEAGSVARVRMSFQNWLAPGRYRLLASVARGNLGREVLDSMATTSLVVSAERHGGGLTDLPHVFDVERG
jgi:ABC-type polysaccharide/polyol phosphate transport system ATPase subunit